MALSSYFFPFLTCCLGLIIGCQNNGHKTSSLGASSGSLAKTCIEKIIAKDDSLGTIRNHACETIPLAGTILQYAESIEQLDYSHCPSSFENAFKNHAEAWRQMIPFVEQYPMLRGEMHDLFDELEKGKDADEFKPLLKEVWDTWSGVEKAMKK